MGATIKTLSPAAPGLPASNSAVFRFRISRWLLPFSDPRLLQIVFLGVLLAAGAWLRDFDLKSAQIALTFVTALTVQHFLSRAARKSISYRSAFITALSVTLLLRADSLWAHPAAAAVAIGSKFTFQFRGKHLFNPATFGIVLSLLLMPGTWVSPGQWGQDIAAAGWMVALGAMVVHRADRADISWGFLLIYMGAFALRVEWLGLPLAVWTHHLGNGALLLFAFFMISDPMTSPNHRRGRIAHALLVGLLAYLWEFSFYRTNGFIWALFVAAPAVPLWDALWPAPKFQWTSQGENTMNGWSKSRAPRVIIAMLLFAVGFAVVPSRANAFCGFYVGKADAHLYNHASQVVYVRDGDRTVLSIMNDYQGEPAQFALVVPVPEVLHKDQIHIGDRALFQHLDAYSAPRLVEYYDPDPCVRPEAMAPMNREAGTLAHKEKASSISDKALGVTIEDQYTVGEYDIVILSATQSDGLEQWLHENNYHVPGGLSAALTPYIRQQMKFFVARVNLKEHRRTGLSYLRPLQFAFESPKFMLPIRLGMINARGPQDLIIYLLTRGGRVETTNYRTVKLPTGIDVPEYLRDDFADFYRAMFNRQVAQNDMRAVFTEYAWNMAWCDPCSAPPLSPDELRQLGVFWLNDTSPQGSRYYRGSMLAPAGGPQQAFLTRLHLRYSATTFPEDLVFQQTQDEQSYQVRFVMRHAWAGSASACPAAKGYFEELRQRRELEAQSLADLTGWSLDRIYTSAGLDRHAMPQPTSWWQGLWQ